jgi:hypothetical protein
MFKGDSYNVKWSEIDECLDYDCLDRTEDWGYIPAPDDSSEHRLGAILPRRTAEEILDQARWYDWWLDHDRFSVEPADLDKLDESLDPDFVRFDPEGDPEYKDC